MEEYTFLAILINTKIQTEIEIWPLFCVFWMVLWPFLNNFAEILHQKNIDYRLCMRNLGYEAYFYIFFAEKLAWPPRRRHSHCGLRGPGRGYEVNFHFLIVSDREECQLPGICLGMTKYCS